MTLCLELLDLSDDLFVSKVGSREWIVPVFALNDCGTVQNITKYIKLGMKNREFLLGKGGGEYSKYSSMHVSFVVVVVVFI